jgi:uncharacterized protein YlxP (DUF503 family)
MLQVIFALDGITSIKDKRHVVKSAKDKLQQRFHLSAAEVDLQDSLGFAQVGAALVSNSREYGEAVLQKALAMLEDEVPARLQDVGIYSEEF